MGDVNRTLTAVEGVLVGHYQRRGRGWLTGTTVVLTAQGSTAGVDVRGGAPGTRETELLRPENLVQQVHAVCLTGGSAYGLAAADGVMRWCGEHHVGYPVGAAPHEVVPIVPAAVIFDLGRGGPASRFEHRPNAEFGYRATVAASRRVVSSGVVGAGTGAVAGGLKGGIGCAALTMENGTVVAALAVVNAAGSLLDPASGLPWVDVPGMPLRRPDAADRRRLRDHLSASGRPLNTTLGVIATTQRLTKAECTKVAQVAQDGLARAARPSHLMVDGDTVFALSTGAEPIVVEAGDPRFRAPDARPTVLNQLLAATADCFAAACVDGLLSAHSVAGIPSYRDLCPSAFAAFG